MASEPIEEQDFEEENSESDEEKLKLLMTSSLFWKNYSGRRLANQCGDT